MRFINKGPSPDFFEQEKRGFPLTENSSWKEFQNPCKRKLKSHLVTEQNDLCAYCECDLSATRSHIEHLAPRAKYKNLMFAYENLVASCDGLFLYEEQVIEGEYCGHRKDRNTYSDSLFLSPVREREIQNYFAFDAESGAIRPSGSQQTEAAEETIRMLNLDVSYLREARKNAKAVLIEGLSDVADDRLFFQLLEDELSSPREFISFLQYCFSADEQAL